VNRWAPLSAAVLMLVLAFAGMVMLRAATALVTGQWPSQVGPSTHLAFYSALLLALGTWAGYATCQARLRQFPPLCRRHHIDLTPEQGRAVLDALAEVDRINAEATAAGAELKARAARIRARQAEGEPA
jgi:hypothetical protein